MTGTIDAVKAYLDQPVGWSQAQRAAYGIEPLGRSILSRAAYNENRLGRIAHSICGSIGFVLKTGALLAIGGGLVWIGWCSGQAAGVETGFREGCRAVAAVAVCDHAEDIGAAIRRLKMRDPGKPISAQNQEAIAELCRAMWADVPRGLAERYGCDG